MGCRWRQYLPNNLGLIGLYNYSSPVQASSISDFHCSGLCYVSRSLGDFSAYICELVPFSKLQSTGPFACVVYFLL